MKKNYVILFLSLFLLISTTGYSTSHTIISTGTAPSNFAFSPMTVSADVGDSIIFTLASFHFPKEVDSTTWANNDSTSNGGFVLPLGGGTIVVTEAKIYYYVCGIHFADGMKGRLLVTNPTGIHTLTNAALNLEVFPNPVSSRATVKSSLPAGKESQISMFDIYGRRVYLKDNILSVLDIDLSGFPSGVYFVALKTDDVYLERKLIVSR